MLHYLRVGAAALVVIVAGNSTFVEFEGEGDFADGPAVGTKHTNRPAHVGTDSALSRALGDRCG